VTDPTSRGFRFVAARGLPLALVVGVAAAVTALARAAGIS
jgi:hypothetical protein